MVIGHCLLRQECRMSKGGEFATNRREDQEITMLSLHLLQLCLVYINTLMIQQVCTNHSGKGACIRKTSGH
jgi:TnpA family transposase